MTTHVVLIHGGESTGKKLKALMPAATVTVIYNEGLSSAYNEVTGIASKYPTLPQLMAHYVPSWSEGDPLIVLAYSAGGWALRYYLRDPAARELVTAAIFLDSLYASGGACEPFGGVVEYAQLAQSQPTQHRLVMTYSQAHPGPGICSEHIAKAAGGGSGPGVFVVAANNADHGGQQGIVGPQVFEKYIVGWVPAGRKSSSNVLLCALAVLGGAGAVYLWNRKRQT